MVLDTSGFMPVVEQTVNMLANRGRIGLLEFRGSLDAALTVPILQRLDAGGDGAGNCRRRSESDGVPAGIDRASWGRSPADLDRFSRSYRLDQINEAIDDTHHGRAIKAVLLID